MSFGSKFDIFESHLTCSWLFYICYFLFETYQKVNCWNLIYSSSFTSVDDWMIFQNSIEQSSYQNLACWDKNIFGGTGSLAISKTFFLPPHYDLDIRFYGYFSQPSDVNLLIQVDDEIMEFYFQINVQQPCNGFSVSENFFGLSKFHSSKTVQLQIINEQSGPAYFWGISNVNLEIMECPLLCDSCDQYGICEKWTFISILFGEQILQVADGWLKNDLSFSGVQSCGGFELFGPFSNNDVIKAELIIPKIHFEIRIRFKIISVEALSYELIIQVQNQEQIFFPLSNQNIRSYQARCGINEAISNIDASFQHSTENLIIQIQIQNSDTSNFFCGSKDFEIFANLKFTEKGCDDHNIYSFDGCFNFQYDCSEGCSSCLRGYCLECQSNWVYDVQNQDCIPFCGDRVIVGLEECDDSNQVPNDGCYQCQFSCPLNCQLCQFGQCQICNAPFLLISNRCIKGDSNNQYLIDYIPSIYQCQLECIECQDGLCIKCLNGWKVSNFECVQECGDGILADSKEQCDDGNYYQYDGCYNCKYEQSLTNALSVCGDGIVQDFEQCDDQNNIPFDGCFECQFQCEQNCLDCKDGICLFSQSEGSQMQDCDFGFYLTDNKCLSICGDLIIAADEKCDDENNLPYDGCFQCQYSCSLNCQNCVEGQCITCNVGYYLNNNICTEQCGDGIKTFNEMCDDGNTSPLDGCSENCQIEIFWNCITNTEQRSQCFQVNTPILQLQYLNTTFNKQFVLLKSNQQIRLKQSYQNLTNVLQTSIQNVSNLTYIINIQNLIEPAYDEYKYINYLFIVELLQQLDIELIFQVSYNISLVNNYDLEVSNKELKLKLKNPIVLSEEQRIVSTKASQFNTIVLIVLGVSSFIIFLSGNPTNCFEVLDALQQQSYLKFINVVFPENLFIYFESSELLSTEPFLIKFNLVALFQIILGQEFLQSFQKFYFYQINADLLINFQSQIFQIAVYLLLAFVYFFYVKIQLQECFTSKQLITIWIQKSKILEKIAALIYKINKIILSFGSIFSINGLIVWFLANSWDILFKIMLYFYSKPQSPIRTQFSCILSLLIIAFLILLSISYLTMTSQNHKMNKLKIFRHQGLIIMKKFLFLLFLIQGQNNSIIQCILIGLINTFYLGYIIIAKLLEDIVDIIVIFWFELPIILFTLSSLIHHGDFVKHITNDQQIYIGFIQIGILCFGLLSPLFKYAYILIKKAKNYITQRYKQMLAEKSNQKQIQQIFL